MKEKNIKVLLVILMMTLFPLVLSSCRFVDKLDSPYGILGKPAPDYEIRELKKGEEAFFDEYYQEANRLFTLISSSSGNEIYQKHALYGIACLKMMTAENAEEYKQALEQALELLDDWQKPEIETAGFRKNKWMLISALKKQSHLLECEPEIKLVYSKKSKGDLKKQQKEIDELKSTIKKLQHQISVLEAIDQEIEEKRKPI